MCHRPSEPSADRARTVSVARRPTAWSCCGTIKSSSAVRNQSFAGPATDAAVPTRRRCPGTVGTGVPARRPEPSAHGGRCSSAAGTFNQNTQRRLLMRADVRPGGFRRCNSTTPRLSLSSSFLSRFRFTFLSTSCHILSGTTSCLGKPSKRKVATYVATPPYSVFLEMSCCKLQPTPS